MSIVKQLYHLSEHELIKGCVEQNPNTQRLLFEQYAGKFMTICLRYATDVMEAEDMMQEGFVRIFTHLHQFKFEGSFEGWMRRIVVNVCLKHLQKRKIQFKELAEDSRNEPALHPYTYSSIGEDELLKLISRLPDGYRMVFNLNVVEGYSHEEIAVLLGIQASTSRSQLVKARKMLQNQIIQLERIAV
ncbi:RNA polymerase sigma factor [Parasediminibacterium sp. JCM 36343]|uniref:RNA polymerase sigma factor n=1 Tax=Parasediminibacterium sp. JCM 36343 TaxID=3374279 RepID=UPI00397C9ABD